MSGTEATPPPWRARFVPAGRSREPSWNIEDEAGDVTIARGIAEPNVSVIVAAPDLLSALCAIVEACDAGEGISELLDEAREAIDKAEAHHVG